MTKKGQNVKYRNLLGEMAKNGDTQESLAEVVGISRQHIARKLEGKYDWTITEIDKICEHYKKDYYELFKGE